MTKQIQTEEMEPNKNFKKLYRCKHTYIHSQKFHKNTKQKP